MADFVAALDGRIRSMATTQELLSSGRWQGISLTELIRHELAPYATPSNTKISGHEVLLRPEAGQAMAMVLHELATNAAKYGALAADRGTIEIRCAREADKLELSWIESGGPARPPAAAEEGFGSYLLRATVRGLGGDITHEWRDAGVTIHLSAALPYVQAADDLRPE